MEIRSYQELVVWQKAMDLVVECYRTTEDFPKAEIYGLTSQLRRAAVSVPANIAEGQGRLSTKVFIQFLSIACGSLAELETHIQIAQRLSYLNSNTTDKLLGQATEVSKMLRSLIKALEAKLARTNQRGSD